MILLNNNLFSLNSHLINLLEYLNTNSINLGDINLIILVSMSGIAVFIPFILYSVPGRIVGEKIVGGIITGVGIAIGKKVGDKIIDGALGNNSGSSGDSKTGNTDNSGSDQSTGSSDNSAGSDSNSTS